MDHNGVDNGLNEAQLNGPTMVFNGPEWSQLQWQWMEPQWCQWRELDQMAMQSDENQYT